ncbi:VirB4 family type IV secretion system protein [Mycoplasmopsis glycophila]|uniref:VirB4 family type IV secretion system protein n=1 Tax=Mycoplasmopsis glycophila TaxID=171285 RepID=UPI0013EBF166|nr:hypothetical protein [Mycoplasmopsis glycophila]
MYKALVFLFSKRKYKKQELNQLIPYKNIINDNVLILYESNLNKYIKIVKFQGFDIWTQNEIDITKKLEELNFAFENINTDFEIIKTNEKNDLSINLQHLEETIDAKNDWNKTQIDYFENLVKDINYENENIQKENYYVVLKAMDLQNLETETTNLTRNLYNIGINNNVLNKLEIIDLLGVLNNYEINFEILEKFLKQESENLAINQKVKQKTQTQFTFWESIKCLWINLFQRKRLKALNLNAITKYEDLILYQEANIKLSFWKILKNKFNKTKLKELQIEIDVIRKAAKNKALSQTKETKKVITLNEIYYQEEFEIKNKYIKYKDGDYQTFLSLKSLPFNLNYGYLNAFLTNYGNTFFKFEKMNDKKTDDVINYALKKTMEIEINKKATINRMNDTYVNTLQEILDNVVEKGKNLYTFNCYVEIKAKSLQELKSKVREIKVFARNNKIKLDVPTFNINEAFLSNKLCKNFFKDNNKTVFVENIIQGWAFLQNSFNDYNNLFVGKGINGEYIFFDRFKKTQDRTNANMFITGTSGAGKSTFAEKMILNDIANNRDVIVLDLQQEYKQNGLMLGATILDFTSKKQPLSINVLQVRDVFEAEKSHNYSNNLTKINRHIDYLEKFFRLVFKEEISQSLISYLKKALGQLYKENGYFDDNVDLSKIPNDKWITISDLIKKLENYTFETKWEKANFEEQIKLLSHQLKLYFETQNVLSTLFNNHTNFDINSQYTIFDLHNIINTSESGESYNDQIILFVLLNFLQDKIAKNRENKKQMSLFIGEAHFFVKSKNQILFDFLFFTIKTARKYGLSVVMDTQNLSDFYREKDNANALLSNCDYSLFLRQKSSEIEDINEKLFSTNKVLTQTEQDFLERASVGQGILNIGANLRYIVKLHYNDYEQELLFKSKGDYI